MYEYLRTRQTEILEREGPSRRGLAILSQVERVSRWYGWTRRHLRAVEAFWSALGQPRPFRVIDVGAGTGKLLEYIAEWAAARAVPVELTGVEIHPTFAERARERLGDRARVLLADFMAFEPGEHWHLATSTLMLHHIAPEQRAKLILSMRRVASALYVFDLQFNPLWVAVAPLGMVAVGCGRDTIHDGVVSVRRSCTRSEFRALLEDRRTAVCGALGTQSTWPRR